MDKRFERRLELAKNPRARKCHAKASPKFERPGSNVAAVIEDMLGPTGDEDLPARGEEIFAMNPHQMARNIGGAVAGPLLLAHHVAVAAAMDGVDAVKARVAEHKRKKNLPKRRKYYAAAAERREEMREQIRAARPAPLNPCPTPEALVEAYRRRREGDEWLRFGELMIDLEEHVRREYAITGNKFTGSSGGVKDWLKANCPLLAKHYSTSQRYKRLAQDYHTQVNG